MTKVKTIAGIDVSKRFFDVCILLGRQPQPVKQFGYDQPGLVALVEWLPPDCHCIMEATGPYYLRLACYLHQQGFLVSVVNPLVIRRFSQMRLQRAKTDRSDAKLLAAYGVTEQPLVWQPPAADTLKLQQLAALRWQLQKQRTALLCQAEAFAATALMEKEVKQFLQKALRHLDKQLEQLHQRMEAIVEAHHHTVLHNLTTIPGLGKKTAIVLIVLSDGFKKFTNYKQLCAYVGLSPRVFESGSSIKGKARICKMGMGRIRAMLYVCAWSARRCNKACRELYERLLIKGKAKRLALIAVANKLLKQAFAIATTNAVYKADYSKNIWL